MSDVPPFAQPFACAAVAGKSFVLAPRSRNRSAVEETARVIVALGGRVVEGVKPELDYVVVVDRHLNRPTREERQADVRGVPVLDRVGLFQLISPTRDEALALLLGGEAGLAQWRLRRNDQFWSPIDLNGVNLCGAVLARIVLHGVTFDGADLSDADLSGSSLGELVRVTLDRANLSGAYVPHLTDCSARSVNLSSARLSQTTIARTDLTGACLVHADGYSIQSQGAVFRGANLTGATLKDSTFVLAAFDGADFTRTFLDRSEFSGSTFRGAIFTGASLMRAGLTDADLTDCDFSRANLAGADLTGAIVEGAKFTDANLYAARLGALGRGHPVGLTAPAPVAVDRIGPGTRRLEKMVQHAENVEASLHIDPDGRGSETVHLIIRSRRRGQVQGYSSVPG